MIVGYLFPVQPKPADIYGPNAEASPNTGRIMPEDMVPVHECHRCGGLTVADHWRDCTVTA